MSPRINACLLRSQIIAPTVAAAWLRFGVIAAHKTGPPPSSAV